MLLSELSQNEIRDMTNRILLSRMRLLLNNGFYGLLLMHMKFGLTEETETALTNGEFIEFNPDFLSNLSDKELDFVMMHEVMHVVLKHLWRGYGYEPERFNIAADIVVNSNILKSNNMDLASISLQEFGGPAMHMTPDGREGYEFTTEEVYEMVTLPPNASSKTDSGSGESGAGDLAGGDKKHDKSCENNGSDSPSLIWQYGRAKHVMAKAFDINVGRFDDHSHFGELEEDDELRDVWVKRFQDVCESISVREASNGRGRLPAFAQRMLDELRRPQTDWRTILNEFVQEELVDYSFSPPDRRFEDSPFFLPDFNDAEMVVKDILFMIDTSGSMSDAMIAAAFSEVKGALDQFNGRLKGLLGFFDAAIIEPAPFERVSKLLEIRPSGGGGTDFQIIFEYIFKEMQGELPACVIILTDGYAPFPQEHIANGIPVLWLLNNEKVEPPWGKVARIQL